MKIIQTIFLILILCLIQIKTDLPAQTKKSEQGESPAPVKSEIKNSEKSLTPESQEAIEFKANMKDAKVSGNTEKIKMLQETSDKINGTVTAIPDPLEIKKLPVDEKDNIVMNSISYSSSQYILGKATCTEQTGNNIGRIWAAYGYSLGPALTDHIGISYSDDNGLTWKVFGLYSLAANQLIDLFQMDAELVINSSNQKYLWLTFETNTSNWTKTGLFIADLNTGSVNSYSISWPGSGSDVYYKTPRIVSDNSAYPNSAYIYIVSGFDSSNSNSWGIHGEKVAVCYNPYTTTPSITYRPSSFMRTVYLNSSHGPFDYFNCDLAYYRNGSSDSILIVETGLESVSSISLGNISIFSFTTGNPNNVYIGTVNVNSNTRSKGYVASNGPYNNLMITAAYQYSATDNDIEYYHSTNGSRGWLRGFINTSVANSSYSADIVGQNNNPGKFALAYSNEGPSKVFYYQSNAYIWSFLSLTNFSHINSYSYRIPKAGIKLNSGSENCFAIWSDSSNNGLWSSSGCTGAIQSFAKLKLGAAIEGFYNPNTNTLTPDTLRVYLRNSNPPYSIIDSSVNQINNIFTNEFIFSNVPYNTPYYIQIKHRNSIESWSSGTIQFTTYEKSYTFLIQSNTYGNNSKLIDNDFFPIYGFYSGDVNQDGTIDLTDLISIYNDAGSFLPGYVNTDVTGDNFVDLTDLLITYNNSTNFVGVIRP